jgi:hypothetical protein
LARTAGSLDRNEQVFAAKGGVRVAKDDFVSMQVTDDLRILVEVLDEPGSGPRAVSRDVRDPNVVSGSFNKFLKAVGNLSEDMLSNLRSTLRTAESVEVEFHLAMSGDMNLAVVKAKTEALLSVKIVWSGDKES